MALPPTTALRTLSFFVCLEFSVSTASAFLKKLVHMSVASSAVGVSAVMTDVEEVAVGGVRKIVAGRKLDCFTEHRSTG